MNKDNINLYKLSHVEEPWIEVASEKITTLYHFANDIFRYLDDFVIIFEKQYTQLPGIIFP